MFRLRDLCIDTFSEPWCSSTRPRCARASSASGRSIACAWWDASRRPGRRARSTGVLNFCSRRADRAGRDRPLATGVSRPRPARGHGRSSRRWRRRRAASTWCAPSSQGSASIAPRSTRSSPTWCGIATRSVELSMFVLACALAALDTEEIIDFTRAMIAAGIESRLRRRTDRATSTASAACPATAPRWSSCRSSRRSASRCRRPRRARSPARPAPPTRWRAGRGRAHAGAAARRGVAQPARCIAWGGALALAPADDILITVERPMEHRHRGADGRLDPRQEEDRRRDPRADRRSRRPDREGARTRRGGAPRRRSSAPSRRRSGCTLDVVITEAHGPIGRGIGPRLEALDVARRTPPRAGCAGRSAREVALSSRRASSRWSAASPPGGGYRRAHETLDGGAAARSVRAHHRRAGPPHTAAARRRTVTRSVSPADGRIARDRLLGDGDASRSAPARRPNAAAGVRLLRSVGDVVTRGDPLFELHAQSASSSTSRAPTPTRTPASTRSATEPAARIGMGRGGRWESW